MTADEGHTLEAPDGTPIAYAVAGTGPALMLTNGLTTTSFFWKYLRPIWVQRYTVITWELAGHGRSQPARSAATWDIAHQPAIMVRIMDAVGVARAVQIGWSVGCQIVLEMYRQQRARCEALVLLFGPSEHVLSNTALPGVGGEKLHRALRDPRAPGWARLFQRVAQLATLPGGPALLRRLGLIGRGCSDADLRALLADLGKVDPATGSRMACSAEAHSARAILPHIEVPVLIAAGGRDPFAPAERIGRVMHREAPRSELVVLPEATHTALLDHASELASLVDDFLRRRLAHI